SPNTLLFIHGQGNERWLHRVRNDADAEIFKIVRVEGDLAAISPNKNIIVLKPSNTTNKWNLYNLEEGNILELDKFDIWKNEKLTITKIDFINDSEAFIQTINDLDQIRIYKLNLNNNEIQRINFPFSFQQICVVS